MNDTANTEQRVTASQLSGLTNLSRAWISKLKKRGSLVFDTDNDGIDRINYTDALKQLEGSKEYNREGQRKWGEQQRGGKKTVPAVNSGVTVPGVITDADNPHGLPKGNTPAFLLTLGDVKCDDGRIGVETQRSRLVRETYDAKLAEIEFKGKCGESVSIQAQMEANRRIAGSIRSKFIGMGTKLGPRLEGKQASEIQVILEDEVNAILTELYALGGGKEEE